MSLRLQMVCASAAIVAVFGLNACESGDQAGGTTLIEHESDLLASIAVDPDRPEPGQPNLAMRDRWQRRLSADGTVPPNAFMRAKEQRDQIVLEGAAGAGLDVDSWTWLGPGNIGGRIRGLVIDPRNPDRMLIGSASGGVWATTNAGASWSPIDDYMPALAVGCMIMDPFDPDVIYIGTGEGFFETEGGSSNTAALQGAGIFKSTDSGATWNQMPSTATPDFFWVNRIAISPTNSNVLVVATNSGIYRSTDGGGSWTATKPDYHALDVKFDPSDANKLVASGHHEDDIALYSLDGGVTWNTATGIPDSDRVELEYAPSAPIIVYANVSDNNRLSVYRSTNGGQSWVRQSTNTIGTWAAYNSEIWVDPTDVDTIVIGGISVYRSTNAGVTLNRRFSDVHSDHHIFVNHPNFDGVNERSLYFGGDGGMYRTSNVYGDSATELNNNLGITQFYGGDINDQSGVVLGGTQDNFTLRYAGDTENWTITFGGDGGYTQSDPTDPNYWYGEIQRGLIFRSTDGGRNASYIYQGIDDANSLDINFIPYFILDPNNPNRMLVTAQHLWRSNSVKSGSRNWHTIKDPIDQGPGGGKGEGNAHFDPNQPTNMSTVEVVVGDSDTIFVGYNNGQVWYTQNGTNNTPSWTRIDENGATPLPDRWVSQIVSDPKVPGRIYVSVMGWEADNIWCSDAPYSEWTSVTGQNGPYPLPSVPVSGLAVHQTMDGWLYAGTDLGIFTSTDNGDTWSTSTIGPGTVPVEELIWRNNNELLAVTHGRGMYLADVTTDLELLDPVPGIANQVNGFPVGNATSQKRVYVVGSQAAGSMPVPGCGGLVVDLSNPQRVGFNTADSDGVAVITAFVPGGAAGRTVFFQAVDYSTCRKSGVVSYTFQ